MRIYMAGPLFSLVEKTFNTELAGLLRLRGHEVFLPQENEQNEVRPDLVFKSDVAGIDWAEAVVANLDGADADSGTCWELGYAYGKKFCVVYRTDFRFGEDADSINLMMTESAHSVLYHSGSLIGLADRLDRVLRELH